VAVPAQGAHLEGGYPVGVPVVEVVDQQVAFAVLQDSAVPWADVPAVRRQHDGPAALAQWRTVTIDVGPFDGRRAPEADVVGAVDAAAAEVERDEEVEVPVPADEEGGFLGARRRPLRDG